MTVTFVVTASPASGLGHARRCLNLAAELVALGEAPAFLVDGPDPLAELVDPLGATSRHGPLDELLGAAAAAGGVVVVDSYSVGAAAVARLAAAPPAVVVVDDLADRPLPVDVVVNAAIGIDPGRYDVAPATELLLGPAYALLRPGLRLLDPHVEGPPRHVLVTMGGGDLDPAPVARAIHDAAPGLALDVVVGRYGASLGELPAAATLWRDPDMEARFAAADLVVCAGGQTCYEAVAAGRPTVVLTTAANQRPQVEGLEQAGAVVVAGDAGDPAARERAGAAIAGLAEDQRLRSRLVTAGRALVDGAGAARVARRIVALAAHGS